MIDQDRIQDLIPLVALAAIAAALVIVAAYMHLHRPFAPVPGPGTGVSPLTITSPIVYLPLVLREQREPDKRLGVAEHTPEEAALLGLAGADYVSGQWRLPLEGDTVMFLRPTERPHWSTWLMGSWSATNGWHDEAGFREWIQRNPGKEYIVGNELRFGGSTGDGHWVNVSQYVQWYYEARALIGSEDPTATIAPYGPNQQAGGLLLAVWEAYRERYGELMPADFYPVHFYCGVDDEPWWCWQKIINWVDWIERHRGSHWSGPCDYRLTEWGLMAWSVPVPQDVALRLMEGVIPRLRATVSGITQFAWWPSGNDAWPDRGTWLVEGGRVTELGRAYLRLALTD